MSINSIAQHEFKPIPRYSSTSEYAHRQTNCQLCECMSKDLISGRVSKMSTQVRGAVWISGQEQLSPRPLRGSRAVTNLNHRHYQCAASQKINTAGRDRGPTHLPVMVPGEPLHSGERVDLQHRLLKKGFSMALWNVGTADASFWHNRTEKQKSRKTHQ